MTKLSKEDTSAEVLPEAKPEEEKKADGQEA
jgi:hypothetical protein